jgi:zinc transport system ATP-binding protein
MAGQDLSAGRLGAAVPAVKDERQGIASANAHSDSQPHAHGHSHHHGEHCHAHHHDHGAPATAQPHRADALISARGLWMKRGARWVLEGVDLDIGRSEIVTLIGPNGAGKTTLVRVLLALETADRGEVKREAGLTIGYAPQRFDRDPAIPMTVARFLSMSAPADRRQIAATLEEVGAGHVAAQQLHGLSGGELQRVILARALIRNPSLLVLDEPVRGVDYVGEAELYGLIGRLRDRRGLGVLLVSHDLHVVMAQSDRVVCLSRHICCQGVPETVAQHPEYVRLFGDAAARALGIYRHSHDHAHDLAGVPLPAPGPIADPATRAP